MIKLRRQHDQRTGASAILIVFMFVVLMIFAFMNINLANIQRHRISSQIGCDFASRFGADLIGREADVSTIESIANEMVKSHTYKGAYDDTSVDVILGTAIPINGIMTFQANGRPVNAVQVNTTYEIPAFGLGNQNTLTISNSSVSSILERDVCLVIDRSGSMNFDLDRGSWIYDGSGGRFHSQNFLAQSRSYSLRRYARYWWQYRPHPTNSRWTEMIPAVYGLADELDETIQQENFSIVSFSTRGSNTWYSNDRNLRRTRYSRNAADIEVPLTKNYRDAARRFDQIYTTDKLVAGGTDISAGIDLAARVLIDQGRDHAFKTMVVMTDGQQNGGRLPWLAAADAAAQGVEVYTVTFSRHADQAAMITTADQGNGQHFHAPDGDSLEEIFRQIANIPPKIRIQ